MEKKKEKKRRGSRAGKLSADSPEWKYLFKVKLLLRAMSPLFCGASLASFIFGF